MKSKLNFLIEYQDGTQVDMHEKGIWVDSFHIYSPNVERKLIEVAGMDGALLSSTKIKVRKVDISLQVETNSPEELDDLKHDIYDMFFSEEEFKIIRDISPNTFIYVLQEGEYDIENITDSDGTFNITLTMIQPYKIGEEILNYFTDSITINNNGTAKTKPYIKATFTAAASELKVTHQESGQYVRVTRNFVIGDVLELDFAKEKVIINGKVSMTSLKWAESDFFNLLKGSNTLNVDPLGVADNEIRYKERWL